MKRILIASGVLALFLLNQYLLPQWFVELGIDSMILYTILGFISMVTIPIIMVVSIKEVEMVRYASIALLLTTVSFFILDITNVTGAIAGYAYIVLIVSNIALLVTGLVIPEEFYFGRRAGIFLILATITMFLRYAQPVQILYTLIDEYNEYREMGWPTRTIFTWVYSGLYLLTFTFEVLALDGVLNEKQQIGYE